MIDVDGCQVLNRHDSAGDDSSHGEDEGQQISERTPIQSAAALVGIVFLLGGILGFVPGVTTHYGDLSFAGHGSGAKLLGMFQVSILHNLFHLLFGVVGLVLARTAEGAGMYLTGGGIVYLALWVLGAVGVGRLAACEHRRQLAALPGRDRAARPRLRRRSRPRARSRLSERATAASASLACPVHRQHFGDDLERDLRGRLAAQVEADRPAHLLCHLTELFGPLCLGALRAERTDVERTSFDTPAKRGEIDAFLVHE